MSKNSIVRTLLAATFVASLCTACSDGNKNHTGHSRTGTFGGEIPQTECIDGIEARSSIDNKGNEHKNCTDVGLTESAASDDNRPV